MSKHKLTDFENEDSTTTMIPDDTVKDMAMKEEIGFRNISGRTKLKLRLCTKQAFILILSGIVLALLISVIVLAIQLGLHKSKKEFCLTPACVSVASSVLNSMNQSIDPCDDFYMYSCGGWIKSHRIPDGLTHWGILGQIWDENKLILKNELESEPTETPGPNNAREKARQLYKSCMDENKAIESLKAQPLLDVLEDLGGWGLLQDMNDSSFDFNKTLRDISVKYNLGLILPFEVAQDEKNSKVNILQIGKSILQISDSAYYLNKTATEAASPNAYIVRMVLLAELLNAPANETEIQLLEVVKFKIKLANLTKTEKGFSDYVKMNISKVQEIMPAIDWLTLLQATFKPLDIDITSSEPIIVYCSKDFISNLSTLLMETEPRVLHNYMMWQVVDFMAGLLSEDFKVLYGKTTCTTKSRFCVTMVDTIIGMAAGAMFVDAAFKGGNSKSSAKIMVEEIRDAFEGNLPDLVWLDDETRKAVKEKVCYFLCIEHIVIKKVVTSHLAKLAKFSAYLLTLLTSIYIESLTIYFQLPSYEPSTKCTPHVHLTIAT